MRAWLLAFGLLAASPTHAEVRHYSSGTGFFVNKLGHVVTNAHVVPNCKAITVAGRPATLMGADPTLDVAVLKVTPTTLTIAPMRYDISTLVPGEKVVVMGFPGEQGFKGVSTYRTGAFIERQKFEANINSTQKTTLDGILIDPIAAKGNSGGPVMDGQGRVIGVIRSIGKVFKTDQYGRVINGTTKDVAMAIPLPLVQEYLRTLRVTMLFEHGGLVSRSDAQMQQEARKFILPIRCLQ